jgi:hypothetical protein
MAKSKAMRKLPRREAVSIVRLLSNHHLLRGHFYRLAIKTQARAVIKEEQCRFCLSHLETPEHILFECEEIYVMEQRSESDLNNPTASCPTPKTIWFTCSKTLRIGAPFVISLTNTSNEHMK